jgi:hypothetical protein
MNFELNCCDANQLKIQNSKFITSVPLLVAAEGIEPSSPVCKTGVLPLNEAAVLIADCRLRINGSAKAIVLVAGSGIEPPLQAYETRQTPRPSHPLPIAD